MHCREPRGKRVSQHLEETKKILIIASHLDADDLSSSFDVLRGIGLNALRAAAREEKRETPTDFNCATLFVVAFRYV